MTIQLIKERDNGLTTIFFECNFLKMKKYNGYIAITDTKGVRHNCNNKYYDYITIRK